MRSNWGTLMIVMPNTQCKQNRAPKSSLEWLSVLNIWASRRKIEDLQFENWEGPTLGLLFLTFSSRLNFAWITCYIKWVVLLDMFLICEIRTQCFKIDPGFCIYSGMVKPTDQEIIIIIIIFTGLKSRGHVPQCRATQGSTSWSRGRRRERLRWIWAFM